MDQKHTKGQTECILIRQTRQNGNFQGNPLLHAITVTKTKILFVV